MPSKYDTSATNYYAAMLVDGYREIIRIGVARGNWVFALQVYPELNIWNHLSWLQRLEYNDILVQNEYGKTFEPKEFFHELDPSTTKMISKIYVFNNGTGTETVSSSDVDDTSVKPEDMEKYITPDGYESWKQFHDINGSEFNYNAYLRRKVDHKYCIAHSKHYDICVGDFAK